MKKRFEIPKDALSKDQIMNLIFESLGNERGLEGDQGDLAAYAETRFGFDIFSNGFDRWGETEVQMWYYREYLPDRAADIEEGFDRGQFSKEKDEVTEAEEEAYMVWYSQGASAAEILNKRVEKLRKDLISDNEDFIESAFFDGLRDNFIVDGD